MFVSLNINHAPSLSDVLKILTNKNFLNDIANSPLDNIYAVPEDDLDSKATIFENYFKDVIDLHAPLKTITVKYPKAPWLTDDIRKNMDDRDKQKNIFNSIKKKMSTVPTWSPEHCNLKRQLHLADDQFKMLRNVVNRKIRQSKKDTFNSEVNDKLKYAKQYHAALKKHDVVESKFSGPNTSNFDPNTLNSVFTSNNNAHVDEKKVNDEASRILNNCAAPSFSFKEVSVPTVVKIVKSLKSNACGVDNISSQFSKWQLILLRLTFHILLIVLLSIIDFLTDGSMPLSRPSLKMITLRHLLIFAPLVFFLLFLKLSKK